MMMNIISYQRMTHEAIRKFYDQAMIHAQLYCQLTRNKSPRGTTMGSRICKNYQERFISFHLHSAQLL